jgi:hypothetical protein
VWLGVGLLARLLVGWLGSRCVEVWTLDSGLLRRKDGWFQKNAVVSSPGPLGRLQVGSDLHPCFEGRLEKNSVRTNWPQIPHVRSGRDY